MPVERFGDWAKVRAKLATNPGLRLTNRVRLTTARTAATLVREIQKGITSQAPGGKPFVPLAQSTIDRKGSSKALIDTGFLRAKVTSRMLPNGSAFVGLLVGTTNAQGEDLVNIGAVMEYGATITFSSGRTIVIPPRPFLSTTWEQFRAQAIEAYRDALLGGL
jgi:hypothetical protein